MTAGAAGWGAPDLGLDRMFDLSPSAVRRRTRRRRLLVVSLLVVVCVPLVVLPSVWPDVARRPVLDLPFGATLAGLGLLVLAIVVMLVGVITMSRAGSNPFDNHDPLRDLSRADRTWVRARVAAGAPVTWAQHTVVAGAASWMARQPGTTPIYLGLSLEGLGLAIGSPGIMTFLVGLVLLVEGAVFAGTALGRARTARRWLALYGPAGLR